MQGGKNTPFNVTLIGALLAITVLAENPGLHGAWLLADVPAFLACHFYHASIFHWFCNAMCLWMMRPSPSGIACAIPFAAMSMMFTLEPTIGFSAVLYAYIGVNIIRWKVSLIDWGTFIVVNAITAFIPGIASGVHLAAFLLGIAHWCVERQIKRIISRIEGK